jgi:uncharacterized protein YndB with AHSA1/START domain
VECEREADGWTLVLHRDLAHPPQAVWAALTEAGQLEQWAPFRPDHDLDRVGGTTLTMIDGAETVDLPGSVTRAQPPTLLEYTWGPDRLRWELTATDAGTRLTLRHAVAGPEWVAMVAAGWHLCLVVAERLLEGRPIPPIRGGDALGFGWQELRDAYADQLGVPTSEASPSGA